MFQIKIVVFGRGHKKMTLTLIMTFKVISESSQLFQMQPPIFSTAFERREHFTSEYDLAFMVISRSNWYFYVEPGFSGGILKETIISINQSRYLLHPDVGDSLFYFLIASVFT